MKTTLSAFLGVRSSLSASFTPSARVCSRPNGPVRLGPGRCCIRPMTRRSNQMTSRVLTAGRRRRSSALTSDSHHGVSLKSADGLSRAERQRTRHGRRRRPRGEQRRSCGRPPLRDGDDGRRRRRRAWRGPRDPAELVGSQTTWSTIVGDRDGRGDRAALGAHRDGVAVDDAERSARWPARPAPGRAARCRRGTARRPASGPGRAGGARWPGRPGRRPGSGTSRGADGGSGRRGHRSTAPSSAISARISLERCARRGTRPSRRRACPAPGSRSCSAVSQRRLEGPRRGPPSRRTCRPSRRARPPGDDVGDGGDRGRADLQGDDERPVERGVGGRGSARSAGSTPPTTSAPSSPARGRRDDGGGVAAGLRRAGRDAPGLRRPRRGRRRRSTGRPPGSRAGSAPASSAPRSPARRGTQASRAPVASASAAAARQGAGDGGEPLADEHDGALAAQRLGRGLRGRAVPVPSASASSTSASVPGAAGISVPPSFSRPRVANGATA